MNRFNYFFFFGLLVFFLSSCENETKNPPADVNEKPAVETQPKISFDEKFRNLIKTDSGLFRGVSFGMPISLVKTLEDSLVLGDDTLSYLNYLITFNVNEEADLLYYFDRQKKVNRIEVNIYPEDQNSQTELFEEFEEFLTKKFGNSSSVTDGEKIWESPDKSVITVMKKTGNGKVHDIKIDFRPAKLKL